MQCRHIRIFGRKGGVYDDSIPSSDPGHIITLYEELPPSYKDAEGLRFQTSDLSASEVLRVFGPGLHPDRANSLLRILHGRRVAGTLDDPAFAANTARFTQGQKEKALKYLREVTPVDEVLHAGLRAQDELAQLEKELHNATAKSAEQERAQEDGGYVPDPVYGYSHLEALRHRNIAKTKLREAQEEEERRSRPVAEPGTLAAYLERRELTPQMQKWQDEGKASNLAEAPRMTRWERLAPSVTFCLLVVGGCVAFAMIYTEPNPQDRLFPEISVSTATLAAIIGLNVLVYCMWRVPPLWSFLNKYFLVAHGLPRPASMFLSTFSHEQLGHLLRNLALLWFVGGALHDDIGRGNFLAMYLASGVIGATASLCWYPVSAATLGASGAVLGVTTAYFYLHRLDRFKIFGLPPDPMQGVPGIIFLALTWAVHFSAMIGPALPGLPAMDMAAHVGGMLTGMLYMHLLMAAEEGKKKQVEAQTRESPHSRDRNG